MKIGLAFALCVCALTSHAQQHVIAEVVPTGLSPAANHALAAWVTLSREPDAALQFKSDPSAGMNCQRLQSVHLALFIAPLSHIRRCYPEETSLAALDVPLMALDSREVRQVLNGPLGAAVAQGLTRVGLVPLALVEGESRVISSSKEIRVAADLRGRRVITDSPSEATSAWILAAGGSSFSMSSDRVQQAATAGLADTADLALSKYARDLAKVQPTVLLSNHAVDPLVITIARPQFLSLDPLLAGAMEGETRKLARMMASEQRAQEAGTVRQLQQDGVRVSVLAKAEVELLRSPLQAEIFTRSTARLAGTDAFIRAPGLSQATGRGQSPYWKVLFVTNRAHKDGEFQPDFNQQVLYGQADVEIDYDDPASYVDDMKSWLRFLQKGKGIVLDAMKEIPFGADAFDPRPAMPASAPILYIHGFNNTFDEAMRRAAWLGWNSRRPVVLFSWPSQGLPTPDAYRQDARSAERSAHALAGLLRMLGDHSGSQTDVDILCHSMGNKLLMDAISLLASDSSAPSKPVRFRQLLSIAADVPSSRVVSNLTQLQGFFSLPPTLYVSDHDLALGISKRLMNPAEGHRAGLAPPVLVKEPMATVFVGPNDFSFIGHAYFDRNGVIADDMMELLRYGTPSGKRRGHSRTAAGYYELKRLR